MQQTIEKLNLSPSEVSLCNVLMGSRVNKKTKLEYVETSSEGLSQQAKDMLYYILSENDKIVLTDSIPSYKAFYDFMMMWKKIQLNGNF